MLLKRVGIAIVALQYSVVVKGLEKKLQDLGYSVFPIETNLDDIEYGSGDIELFILYIPDNIIDDELKLNHLGVAARMLDKTGKRVMAIGDKRSHEELIDQIPEIEHFLWLEKPVDMDNLEMIMDKALSEAEEEPEEINDTLKRILIVDDDPSYAKMVREWIKYKYRVDIVTAGMQAITFLVKAKDEEQVDLILLDYEMPVVDGPQVLQMLRQDPATKDIPVIFLTGNSSKEAVSRVMELKPEGYILKSSSRLELIKYIDSKL